MTSLGELLLLLVKYWERSIRGSVILVQILWGRVRCLSCPIKIVAQSLGPTEASATNDAGKTITKIADGKAQITASGMNHCHCRVPGNSLLPAIFSTLRQFGQL